MQPLEEKDSSPLEDTEITRLIKVSREVGYKKQDKIPERNVVDFKPTSISQIAASIDNKKENTNKSDPLQSSETQQNRELGDTENASDSNSSDKNEKQNYIDVESNLQETQQERELQEPLEKSSKSLDLSNEAAKEDDKDAEARNQIQEPSAISANTSPNEKALVEEKPSIPQETTTKSVEEAKQEGIEIGKKIALSELANEQQKVLESFRLIVDNIRKKENIDKTELSQSILGVVTRLASERAGNAIDKDSEAYKNKIISFVDRIEKASKKLVLKLNPKDASIIEKSLWDSFDHEEFEIRESSELFRGDFILQMGSVEIGDLISEQVSIKEDNDAQASEKEKTQIEAGEQENKEINSEDASSKGENNNIQKSSGDEIEK